MANLESSEFHSSSLVVEWPKRRRYPSPEHVSDQQGSQPLSTPFVAAKFRFGYLKI